MLGQIAGPSPKMQVTSDAGSPYHQQRLSPPRDHWLEAASGFRGLLRVLVEGFGCSGCRILIAVVFWFRCLGSELRV